MTVDLIAGAVAFIVAALGALIWYANRAGKNAASVSTSEADKVQADTMTQKAQSMAQAQADKPATEDAVLQRLEDGTA
ncbi:hypothetical protein [Asaia spathodeae]|uniref:Uncharacterized protein n=1 Tax=Asaia spathodeae TaxID=657016 RepID=A0ABX2P8I9_9PROT|nr:hypothetical protein [Asaia spathodeae]GBR18784.1 hypothetical protein AA105894_2149 [Asaia spathodeae NBRC 105894]